MNQNGNIAPTDPIAAARNFLNALLQSIVGKQWKKEHELRELKGQLQELDKKIQAELSKNEPKAVEKQNENSPDVKKEPIPKGDTVPTVNVPTIDTRQSSVIHL